MKGAISIGFIVGLALIFPTTTAIIISAILTLSGLWTWIVAIQLWRARRHQQPISEE